MIDSQKILKNFPYESAYVKNSINDEHCANLLKYIQEHFASQKEVLVSSIKDETFWGLLIKTDLADLIFTEIDELLESYYTPIQSTEVS